MSFEGSDEYLCEVGHYTNEYVYNPGPRICACGKPFVWHHLIDTTNGSDSRDDWTVPAPKDEIGFEDIQHKDHYDNVYYTKCLKYGPPKENSRWQRVPTAEDGRSRGSHES